MASRNGPGAILSQLLRVILKDLEINNTRFVALLLAFISDPKNGIPHNKRDISSARSNIIHEINKESISWKVFIKALRILNRSQFTITIKIKHDDDIYTEHSLDVNLGPNYTYGNDEQDED